MIADPDRYEPRAGDTVLDFARHYGTSFLPARVYRPQDKPKVEVAVQVVERWIMARLRHRQFESVQSVDDAIRPLLKSLNERPFQKLPGCRASAFTELDAPALQPLPVQPYELARFKAVTVGILCGQAISVALALMSCFRRRSSQSEDHRNLVTVSAGNAAGRIPFGAAAPHRMAAVAPRHAPSSPGRSVRKCWWC